MSDDRCKTRYPIVLIHGAGFRDLKWPVYWGRIPGALERRGAQVFYGLQDCWASTETNAAEIVRRIEEIQAETGAEKNRQVQPMRRQLKLPQRPMKR